MSPAIPPSPAGFRLRQVAILAALPILALALLPASGVASVPHAFRPLGATGVAPEVAKPSQARRIELAGNRGGNRTRDSDDNFDPYGKDDPNSKKWGEAAGLGGNRYGGLRTGPEAKKEGRNADRDDREPRAPRGEDGGRK